MVNTDPPSAPTDWRGGPSNAACGKTLQTDGNGVDQRERVEQRGDVVAGQDEHAPGRLLQV